MVLNLSLAKTLFVLGLLSREILHSLLHCCYKTSLIFTFPINRRKLKESTQNIIDKWLSALFLVIYLSSTPNSPLPPHTWLIILLKTGKVSQSCINLIEVRDHSAAGLKVNEIP